MFGKWLRKAVLVKKAKEALRPLVKRKCDESRWQAFRAWRKYAFMGRMCALLKYYGSD